MPSVCNSHTYTHTHIHTYIHNCRDQTFKPIYAIWGEKGMLGSKGYKGKYTGEQNALFSFLS